MTEQENLERIKKEWEWFFDKEVFNTNMIHRMSGSYQNCHDLIWLIKTLDKKLQEKNEEPTSSI